MTRLSLILRNLRYFGGVNLALLVGMLVATAVLTGAMLVGDSVRGSLEQLTKNRLGRIDQLLFSRRFFDQSLAQRLLGDPKLAPRFDIAPGIILSGGALTENEKNGAGAVQVLAFGNDWVPVAQGHCILNGPTAAALNLSQVGATVLLTVPDKPDEPREAALSRRAREDTLANLRTTISQIRTSQDMLSLFNPQGGQRTPQNAWVNLDELQNQIDLRGRVNALVVHDNMRDATGQGAALLNRELQRVIHLEDYGLSLEPTGVPAQTALTSRTTYLDPPVIAAAEASGIPLQKVSVNLINSVTAAPTGKQIHYAVAAGISRLDDRELADDEIAINQWTADQLSAHVGDRLHLTYYQRQSTGDLASVSSDLTFNKGFKIVQVLPLPGLGADRTLTPQYKGLTDADTIADWNPPEGVEIDKKLVTKADEDYWHKYRAAPKLFLSFAAAQKLWGDATGNVTSIRIPAARADEFGQKLQEQLDPASMGLAFQPIMAQQLAASNGNTDFGEYFIYFSFFIIVAAVLLVAMLFRLSVEQRARQIGLLSAVGFTPSAQRRLWLGEGMLLASIGALAGIPAAIGYTALIMHGLRTWWIGAVGTSELYLKVAPLTLVYGYVASLLVAFFAILWAVWHVGRTPAATLLAGGWGSEQRIGRSGRVLRICGGVLVLAALIVFATTWRDRSQAADAVRGGGGAVLLCGCLCWLAGVLRPGVRRPANAVGIATINRLGVRNASRHTARSVLAIGLISFAAFTLITVAAFKQGEPTDTSDVFSGSGGFRLIVTSAIPLLGDLNTPQGRRVLGMTNADDPFWNDVQCISMRRWAGQDISCLNLTQPTTPTILAVPGALAQAPDAAHPHRFTFAQTTGAPSNPWDLLSTAQSDGTIPVIADDNTAQYILHLGLGKTIDVPDAAGRIRHLKLVATLSNSIFQSELLMSELNFRQLFPHQDGFGVVLVDCPQSRRQEIRSALNSQLNEYAVNAEPTGYRLAQYLSIQNTYLSTFQALGALGLMLGTIGLAVVLVRTVIERRAELALLASIGFRQPDRVRLVLSENFFLLVLGLLVGTVCAVLAIAPTLAHSSQNINVWALAATLLGVLVIGVICSSIAVWSSGGHITPADLRRE